MSRTLRRGGWGNPLYQHMSWWEKIDLDEKSDPLYQQWMYRKVYSDHYSCSPPSSWKKINNRIDRARWNREARKDDPQFVNHRHWGFWNYF